MMDSRLPLFSCSTPPIKWNTRYYLINGRGVIHHRLYTVNCDLYESIKSGVIINCYVLTRERYTWLLRLRAFLVDHKQHV